MFKFLSEKEEKLFLSNFVIKTYKKGTFLVKEGEKIPKAFILLKGKIAVVKKTRDNKDYVVAHINAKKDVIFNEISLIDEREATSTLKVLENSEIVEIDRDKFFKFIDENCEIGIKILKEMLFNCADHLRKRDKDIITLFDTLEILLKE